MMQNSWEFKDTYMLRSNFSDFIARVGRKFNGFNLDGRENYNIEKSEDDSWIYIRTTFILCKMYYEKYDKSDDCIRITKIEGYGFDEKLIDMMKPVWYFASPPCVYFARISKKIHRDATDELVIEHGREMAPLAVYDCVAKKWSFYDGESYYKKSIRDLRMENDRLKARIASLMWSGETEEGIF
jgi:hypothetical protein